jgi:hypothetical protein
MEEEWNCGVCDGIGWKTQDGFGEAGRPGRQVNVRVWEGSLWLNKHVGPHVRCRLCGAQNENNDWSRQLTAQLENWYVAIPREGLAQLYLWEVVVARQSLH